MAILPCLSIARLGSHRCRVAEGPKRPPCRNVKFPDRRATQLEPVWGGLVGAIAVDRKAADQRLCRAVLPILQRLHDDLAERVEPPGRPRLRHAVQRGQAAESRIEVWDLDVPQDDSRGRRVGVVRLQLINLDQILPRWCGRRRGPRCRDGARRRPACLPVARSRSTRSPGLRTGSRSRTKAGT